MHTIRLRRPWQGEWCQATTTSTAERRCATYQRTFHRPTGLTDQQAVWLKVQPLLPAGESAPPLDSILAATIRSVTLNSQALLVEEISREATLAGAFQTRLDGRLLPFNHLHIEIELHSAHVSPHPPELNCVAEVTIEIVD